MTLPPEAIAAIAVPASGAVAWWVRWSIRTAVREVVNGKVDKVQGTVDGIDQWTRKHDQQHEEERQEFVAAMERQDIGLPDGWERRGKR